jgi:predicted enzyme involved in methoxymalonyl-ACP biosynthesis
MDIKNKETVMAVFTPNNRKEALEAITILEKMVLDIDTFDFYKANFKIIVLKEDEEAE